MADVSISNLPPGTPSGTDVIPYSNGSTTSKVQVQSLPVSYNSLTDKPTIPAAQVNADWNAISGVAQILNKPTISTYTPGYQLYTTAGTYTFVVPPGITKLKTQVIGAGGGGRAGSSCNCGGTGGTSYIISNTTLAATGGGCGFGGSGTGASLLFSKSGVAESTTGQGFYGFGAYGGGGGSGVTCTRPGGTGGLGFGYINVSPGQSVEVVVGAGGGGGCGTNPQGGYGCASAGQSGAVFIEW